MEKKFKVHIPVLPNFLRVDGQEAMMPLSSLSEKEIREFAAEWTEALVKHAQKKIV